MFIAIDNDLISSREEDLETDSAIIWTKVMIKGCKCLYISAVYRPRVSDYHSLEQFKDSVNRLHNSPNAHVVILVGGEFNFPGWD